MGCILKGNRKQRTIQIAERYGLSKIAVDEIIKSYLSDLREDLKKGNNVRLDKLFSIRVKEIDGGYKVAGQVSAHLRNELRTCKKDAVIES